MTGKKKKNVRRGLCKRPEGLKLRRDEKELERVDGK